MAPRRALPVLVCLVVAAGGAYRVRARLHRAVTSLVRAKKGTTELHLVETGARSNPWLRPLDSPAFVPASDASLLRPDDPVVGIRANGKAWALPWFVLKNHHVANLDLDGAPWAITFCERCTGASAFGPVVDGRRLHFRLGGDYRGTPLLVDDETGSLWDIFAGRAFRGPLTGKVLAQRPVLQSTWKEWLADYPETVVAAGANEPRDGHGSKNFPGDPFAGRGLGLTILKLDDRLPPATMVLGVWAGDRARCYPFFELDARGGVVTDTFEGRPIVAFKKPGTFEALVLERVLDGQEVELRFDGGALVDARTGSRFTMFGEAIGGPLAGKKLAFVRSGSEEFNTWAAHHPGAEIFAWTPEKAAAAAAAIPAPSAPDHGHE